MDIDINNFIKGIISRDIKKLYLSFLYILEDLRDQQKISYDEYQRLRKRVLDTGNDSYRNIEEQLNNFDLVLNKK
jgi:hypothetical protein